VFLIKECPGSLYDDHHARLFWVLKHKAIKKDLWYYRENPQSMDLTLKTVSSLISIVPTCGSMFHIKEP
jgi:hypothetical protein